MKMGVAMSTHQRHGAAKSGKTGGVRSACHQPNGALTEANADKLQRFVLKIVSYNNIVRSFKCRKV
jgi:hypothetical protein